MVRAIPTSPATPPLDPQILADLRRLNSPDNPSFFDRLVARFFRSSQTQIDEIRHGVARHDPEALRFAVHALKGSARQLGAHTLSALCERALHEIEDDDTRCVHAAAAFIEAEHARVCRALLTE